MACETIDLRKTGPQNYRQLQIANTEAYQKAFQNEEFAKWWNENIIPVEETVKMYDPKLEEPQYIDGTDFGESMFDPKTVGLEGLNRIQDVRAYQKQKYSAFFIWVIIVICFFLLLIIKSKRR